MCEALHRDCALSNVNEDPASNPCRIGLDRFRFAARKRKRNSPFSRMPSRSSRDFCGKAKNVRLREASARQSTPVATVRRKTGGKGIRTPDLLIANETLYQLSYTPENRRKIITSIAAFIKHCPPKFGIHRDSEGKPWLGRLFSTLL